jgi:hypothetical protein
LFCKKVNNIFNIKSSCSKLVNTRRPSVLSLPLQLVFPGFTLSTMIITRTPLSRMILIRMIVIIMIYSRMTINRMTLSKVILSELQPNEVKVR